MKTVLLLVILGHSVDITTSLVAFDKGGHEMNPLVISQAPAPFIIEGAAVSLGEIYVLKKIAKKHPKIAKTLGYIQFSVSMGAGTNNILAIDRLNRRNNAIH